MMKLLLTGGGTMGPVTPLLAIAEAVAGREDMRVVGLVGTARGLERRFAEHAGLPFFSVHAGKLRRYWDVRNLLAPLITLIGFFESLLLLRRLQSDVVVSGGAFVGVPVLLAGRVLGIRTVAHQQDVVPSLANKIVAPFVNRITVTFSQTASAFSKEKTMVTGNPVRPSILSGNRERAMKLFGLGPNLPTILVFGGGTGAKFINELVERALPELSLFCQILHAAGRGKTRGARNLEIKNYHQVEIFEDSMVDAYAAADLVVSRAGVGTISELSALSKPAVIIPIPGTHQEENGRFLRERGAALVVAQGGLDANKFVSTLREILEDKKKREELAANIGRVNLRDALERILEIIRSTSQK